MEASPRRELWIERLRRRFVEVAARRVPAEAVEDLVQEALTIVLEKGPSLPRQRQVEGRPPVAWCFQVLRNTVGNYYQRRRRRGEEVGEGAADRLPGGETPLEALERDELRRHLGAALDALRRSDGQCWGFFDRIQRGERPRDLAEAAGLDEGALYRRLYRCRQKLRRLLEARGVLA